MVKRLNNSYKIGILDLQGDSEKHADAFKKLDAEVIFVKNSADLKQCDGLVFPGGESSTMRMMIEFSGLTDTLKNFEKPIFATCAGIILLAKNIENEPTTDFAKLDISVARNGWGRQVNSFLSEIEFQNETLEAVFIRAPKILKIGQSVISLSEIDDEPILIEQNNILASIFHPELTENLAIQKYWLETHFG